MVDWNGLGKYIIPSVIKKNLNFPIYLLLVFEVLIRLTLKLIYLVHREWRQWMVKHILHSTFRFRQKYLFSLWRSNFRFLEIFVLTMEFELHAPISQLLISLFPIGRLSHTDSRKSTKILPIFRIMEVACCLLCRLKCGRHCQQLSATWKHSTHC